MANYHTTRCLHEIVVVNFDVAKLNYLKYLTCRVVSSCCHLQSSSDHHHMISLSLSTLCHNK
eukprot:874576-Karenia_brevis.AAC.1